MGGPWKQSFACVLEDFQRYFNFIAMLWFLDLFMQNSWCSAEDLWFRVSSRRVQNFRLEYGSVRSRQIEGESRKHQQKCPSLTWCSSFWVFFGLVEHARWYSRGPGESQFLSGNHKVGRCCWMVQYPEVGYGVISSPWSSVFPFWIGTRYKLIGSNVAEELLQAGKCELGTSTCIPPGVLGWDQIWVWTVSEMRLIVQTSWNICSNWMSSCVFHIFLSEDLSPIVGSEVLFWTRDIGSVGQVAEFQLLYTRYFQRPW
jgi:hypothetical protein